MWTNTLFLFSQMLKEIEAEVQKLEKDWYRQMCIQDWFMLENKSLLSIFLT